jgi:GR25 family glycosyltransferase involved in LPS biosynthesis
MNNHVHKLFVIYFFYIFGYNVMCVIANKEKYEYNNTCIKIFENDIDKILQSIDKVYYINLDYRTDRREQIEKELEKMKIPKNKIERFTAINYPNGYIGCTLSHFEIIKNAINNDYNNIIIFEDDFKFIIEYNEFYYMIKTFFEMNIDFKVIMLSYNLFRSEPYNDLVSYVRDAQTTSGYIVNKKFYHCLYELYYEGAINLLKGEFASIFTCDQIWKKEQNGNWFMFNTRIGIQRESYSDIDKKIVKYGC